MPQPASTFCPDPTHKVMINRLLDYICIICGWNRVLRIITAGQGTAFQIMNVGLQVSRVEDLE